MTQDLTREQWAAAADAVVALQARGVGHHDQIVAAVWEALKLTGALSSGEPPVSPSEASAATSVVDEPSFLALQAREVLLREALERAGPIIRTAAQEASTEPERRQCDGAIEAIDRALSSTPADGGGSSLVSPDLRPDGAASADAEGL